MKSLTASRIKDALDLRVVIEHYGFTPDWSGAIRCPFHQGDNTPSLKLRTGKNTWKCFGCGKGGSAIDFVMELHDVGKDTACRELDATFHLGIYKECSFSERRAIAKEQMQQHKEAEARAIELEWSNMQYNLLARYRRWLAAQKLTDEIQFDIAYLDRLLDRYLGRDTTIKFDAAARINALLSKHPNRGDYDLHSGDY